MLHPRLRDLDELLLTEGQKFALRQLHRIADFRKSALRIHHIHQKTAKTDDLRVDISLDCSRYKHKEGGLKLHPRENVQVYIPSEFPDIIPRVYTAHTRFSGYPHVQWDNYLCLYLSPETQWEPARGMIGFVEQLAEWLKKAAQNELDDPERPLHPPVAYRGSNTCVVVHKNTPTHDQWPWFGAATFSRTKTSLLEINGWLPISELPVDKPFAPALLLDFELPFEYPQTVRHLLGYLKSRGVDTANIIVRLMLAARRLNQGEHLYVVIGTPSRGIAGDFRGRLQHLQVWEINSIHALSLKTISLACELLSLYEVPEPHKKLREILGDVFEDVQRWQSTSEVHWCRVMENRSEIVQRRDAGTPMDELRGKSVAVFGCGALGGAVAEHLVRAGVSCLSLYDNAIVHPGILVRQNYEWGDVGWSKASALKRRLDAIGLGCKIVCHTENIITTTLQDTSFSDGVDLLIDATASLRVRHRLEKLRKDTEWHLPIAAMMVSGQAQHGAWVLAPAEYSGGPLDVYRRLGLAAANRDRLRHWLDAFWNPNTVETTRQPEPGCSDPTFIGSHADIAGLAARMLNHIARSFVDTTDFAKGGLIAKDATSHSDFINVFSPDIIVNGSGIEFRVAEHAWRDTKGWIRTGKRERRAADETGGILFGQLDESLGIVWISAVSGPPEDSAFSPEQFTCGIEGVKTLSKHYSTLTQDAIVYLGTWHSHPSCAARPSMTDFKGIAGIFRETPTGGVHQVMMIIGFSSGETPELGLYLFEKQELNYSNGVEVTTLVKHGGHVQAPPLRPCLHSIGLALSGGGSRAIAFHLGTLRALEDLGMLDDIEVISGVSGGSVTTGLFGYREDSFSSIDTLIVNMLRRGLVKPSLLKLLHPKRSFSILLSFLFATIPSALFRVFRFFLSQVVRLLPTRVQRHWKNIHWLRFSLPRWYSTTHVLAEAIADLVGNVKCDAPTRQNKQVVLNACELRTGTAFRMSNEQFGSWRHGYAPASDLRLADAITASAAYPPLLPPYDWTFTFRQDNDLQQRRVLITDGGVFENLGVSVMEPGRDHRISRISYSVDTILVSDAGVGQFTGIAFPSMWFSRMVQVFNSVMRKVNDATKKRLHNYASRGELDRFVYINLGQIDNQVPTKLPKWINRETVIDYPTNFNAMKEEDIRRLSGRAEMLTRSLITRYLLSD